MPLRQHSLVVGLGQGGVIQGDVASGAHREADVGKGRDEATCALTTLGLAS